MRFFSFSRLLTAPSRTTVCVVVDVYIYCIHPVGDGFVTYLNGFVRLLAETEGAKSKKKKARSAYLRIGKIENIKRKERDEVEVAVAVSSAQSALSSFSFFS